LLAGLLVTGNVSFATPGAKAGENTQAVFCNAEQDAVKWAAQQLKKMTLDEKIGQLISRRGQCHLLESGQRGISLIAPSGSGQSCWRDYSL